MRIGRWLVSGALGLAVLGAGGCAESAEPDIESAGPAVLVNARVDSGSPVTKPPGATSGLVVIGDGGPGRPATMAESDGRATKVPPANPRSINDSPVSPRSERTPPSAKTLPSADTP